MKLEILLSCMHQKDASIAFKSNIQSDVLIINQCDTDKFDSLSVTNNLCETFNIRMLSTTERGLSRSRNMAIENALGDICLLCDDDETFREGYEKFILKAYEEMPEADIIAFALKHPKKKFMKVRKRLGYKQAMKIGSYQISFKRKRLQELGISFDVKMGSGTNNGGGEENKFLFDCLKKGMKLYYDPSIIASVAQTESRWFHGFTKDYFVDKGWTSQRIMRSKVWALFYTFYFCIVHYPRYKKTCSFFSAFSNMFKGIFIDR